ncbi:nuclear transport factor 2 family protein [Parasphingorhabdus sp.]|uniref:nuclear transport factor 2 family protein n=1 Tax=Parasphingorhabdus sp. TaxID=2709688 RepID=UPI00359443FF
MVQKFGTVVGPEALADRAAIEDIIHLHCRGVDRADEAALKHCYWIDATTAYGETASPAHEFCESLPDAIKAFAQTHHQVSNILIDLAEDHGSAMVESLLIACHYSASVDGEDREMTYLGRYLDRFEKRGNQWKISYRQPVMSWSQNAAASHDGAHPALAALTMAGRYPEDPVYQQTGR